MIFYGSANGISSPMQARSAIIAAIEMAERQYEHIQPKKTGGDKSGGN